MTYVLILLLGIFAGMLSGILGAGSSILLLPILVVQFGPKEAVPIMAVAAVLANVAKIGVWWREIDWRAFAAYSITGMPAAALGAKTLLVLPVDVIDCALGVFFLLMIPVGRWLRRHQYRINLWQLALAGLCIGFVTGIVLSTGPLSVPAFTSYGLVRGAFLSTEATASLLLMVAKVVTFWRLGALPLSALVQGLIIGSSVMVGSVLGKKVVMRISITTFERLMELLLLCSGMSLIATAFWPA